MGTASTMACIAETLGMTLPGTAAIPAVHADRLRAAEATGKQVLETARLGLTPSKLITEYSVENALRVLLALGGSTNGILHLTALAGRLGIKISLKRLNELSDTTPVLINLKPTGVGYMEDFHAAGGMGTLLRELQPLLHLDCQTITGETMRQRLEDSPDYVDRAIIRNLEEPFEAVGGLVALFGNLAPGGAILKRSAADPNLFEHTGRAVVFESLEDLADRQSSMLAAASRHVRPGGRLVYATCTVSRRENEEVAEAFVEQHPEFEERVGVPAGLETAAPLFDDKGRLKSLPHRHGTDGFFVARFERSA